MEESKELQGMYKMFRTFIYISLLLEFFVFALDQSLINHFWGFVQNLHAIFGKMGLSKFDILKIRNFIVDSHHFYWNQE